MFPSAFEIALAALRFIMAPHSAMSRTQTHHTQRHPHSPYHPMYWPTWVGIALFRLLSWLPYHSHLASGGSAGDCCIAS